MITSLSSRVVLVTGAAGNLGRAVLAKLGERGACLVALDREQAALEAALAGIVGDHTAYAGVDLTEAGSMMAVIDATLARFGRIDGIVHTVGGFAWSPAATSDAALFQRMFTLNVLTTVNVFGAALAPMRAAGQGSLVAIGAGAALGGSKGMAAYGAAKAGVLRIVESFADELKADGVRVNAVLPSIIDTPQNRADMPNEDHSRWVSAQQVASAIAFLLSDEASAITGAALPIPGRV
jgi:NAD(P)-dependent dehydrogenase (short-subunit alcohol dehydrogenase family)